MSKPATDKVPETTVNSELAQEIEGAVATVVEEQKKEKETSVSPPVEDKPDVDFKVDTDSDSDSVDDKEDDDDVISDDLIERAVKVGIPLKEAKQFENTELLTNMVKRLEEREDKSADDTPADKKGSDDGQDFELDDFIDLDTEEYDDKVVQNFNALAKIIKQQNKQIAELLQAAKASDKDVIEQQLQALGKEYADAAPAGSGERAELEKKLKVLKAGYKAAGEDIADNDLFAEAAKIVLGDVVSQNKSDRKAEQLANRKKMRINRPTDTSIQPKGDPMQEVAKVIDAKHFNKS